MGLFDLFRGGSDINEGVERFKNVNGAILIDVRTPEEFASGNIPKSVNVPLDRIETITYRKESPLFVYCQSGGRSAQACSWLKKQGYQVENIGGIAAYKGSVRRK